MPNPLKILDAVGDAIQAGRQAGKAADAAADVAKTTDAAADATKAAEEASRLTRLKNLAGDHKVATGLGVAGVAGGGYLLTRGGDDGKPETPELVKPNGGVAGSVAGAAGAAKDAFGGGGGAQTVEFDPEVLEPFINELTARADDLEAVLTSAPDAFAALQAYLRRDALGAPTRSGAASPILADLDQALGKTQEVFTDAANGVITQLRGDAARLKAILEGHLDNEESNVAAINAIDNITV